MNEAQRGNKEEVKGYYETIEPGTKTLITIA